MSSPKIKNSRAFLFQRDRSEKRKVTDKLISGKPEAPISNDGGDSAGSTCLGESRGQHHTNRDLFGSHDCSLSNLFQEQHDFKIARQIKTLAKCLQCVKCNQEFKFDDFIDNSIHDCINYQDGDQSLSKNFTTYMKDDYSSPKGSIRKLKEKDDAIGLSDLESSNLIIPEQ
jgi:hypothetical protein